MALVIHGLHDHGASQPFADKYQVPLMFPSNEATTALLGMDAGDLLAEIREFWIELDELHYPHSESFTSDTGATAMPNTGINIQVHGGNVAVNTGNHSAAQVGPNNSTNIVQNRQNDLVALNDLLNQLTSEINNLPSVNTREVLTSHVQSAKEELADHLKPPEKGRIEKALGAIKLGGEAIEGGETIVNLCSQALPLLLSLL